MYLLRQIRIRKADSQGTIHILRKNFINLQHFHEFLSNFLLYVQKTSNYSMKISSKCNVEQEILLF